MVLDFDGVLNAFQPSKKGRERYFWPMTVLKHVIVRSNHPRTYILNYSKEMIAQLNTILADEKTQLLWLTAWKREILRVEPEIGLTPARPSIVVDYAIRNYDDQIGKPMAFSAFMDGVPSDAALCWVDDCLHGDFGYTRLVRDCLDDLPLTSVLTIGPDERYGISRHEMDLIRQFADKTLVSTGDSKQGMVDRIGSQAARFADLGISGAGWSGG